MGPAMIKRAEQNNRADPMAGAGGLQHRCLFCTHLCVYDRFAAKVLRALAARRTCESIDRQQGEVTKKSAIHSFNFWLCGEDEGSF